MKTQALPEVNWAQQYGRLCDAVHARGYEIRFDVEGYMSLTWAPHANISVTTQRLIDQLIKRDKLGRAKYGTTLDRTDLSHEQWLQHMVEELLDGAGYALAAIRTNPEPQA